MVLFYIFIFLSLDWQYLYWMVLYYILFLDWQYWMVLSLSLWW